jgi:hypothetical protein
LWDVEAPTFSRQTAVRLLAFRVGRLSTQERFSVLISVRGWVDPRAIVRLEGLGKLKNPVTSSGTEPATSRLVAQCLNQLYYRVPPYFLKTNCTLPQSSSLGARSSLLHWDFNLQFMGRGPFYDAQHRYYTRTAPDNKIANKLFIGMKVSWRNRVWPFRDPIPAFARRDRGKPQKPQTGELITHLRFDKSTFLIQV